MSIPADDGIHIALVYYIIYIYYIYIYIYIFMKDMFMEISRKVQFILSVLHTGIMGKNCLVTQNFCLQRDPREERGR